MQTSIHPWFQPSMLVGVRAGGYTLDDVLGAGGFGAVYSTRDQQGNPRAVKVLFPPFSQRDDDMEEYARRHSGFTREILFAAGFHHPNIMSIYWSGALLWRNDGASEERQESSPVVGAYDLPYYVTDFLPDDVDRRMRNGLFDPAEAVRIGIQVCEALEALHSADPPLFHLDLNPSNIRLTRERRVVITDFGLVKAEGVPQGVTAAPLWIPPYVVAPEQIAGEDLDKCTDIYQVGALLFYMLTGKRRREFGVMTLLQERPDVPQSLATVIERCTRHDKEMRFQDVTSLKDALAGVKPSWWWKYVLTPMRKARVFLSGVEKWAATIVPPLWRSPVTWLMGAFSAFAIAYVFGWIFPPEPVSISIANSSVKKEWIDQAIQEFNAASANERRFQTNGRPLQRKGSPIMVTTECEGIAQGPCDHYRSGTMMDDTLSRKIEPYILSPAEEFWLRKLEEEWPGSVAEKSWSSKLGRDLSHLVLINGEAPGLLRTPLVIAMWESRANALGCWPASGPNCTWETLQALASSSGGWGMIGRPEWGKLKIGYGQVGRSNSATFTQVLNCMSGLNKTSGLVLEDIRVDTDCGRAMLDLDHAEPFIHDKSETVCQWMIERGPEFLDACISYEREVIETNILHPELREPIVAVYPQDGTIAPTHPFAILDGAPWVSSKQAEAAAVFLKFLLLDEQQSRLVDHGFRPIDHIPPVGGPIDQSHGVDPNANPVIVEMPSTEVIDAVVELWECIRRRDCSR